MAARRASAGGETVGGKFFAGGQFIGAEFVALENGGMQKIEKAVKKSAFENIRHAAFSISRGAKSLIKKSKTPSAAGDAPATRGQAGHNIRSAIFTDVQPDNAIIGPRFSFVGKSARAHEFGESIGDDHFDERPFMEPALQEALPRFLSGWQGSIGE